ncbi:MAG: hypothetical protein AAF078_11625 [Planctomycetota bacterium]
MVSASVEETPPPQRTLYELSEGSEQQAAAAAVLIHELGMGGHDAKRFVRLHGPTLQQVRNVVRNVRFLEAQGQIRKTPIAYAIHCLRTGHFELDGRIVEAEAAEAKKAERLSAAEAEARRQKRAEAEAARLERATEARLAAMEDDELGRWCDAVLEEYALTLMPAARRALELRDVRGRVVRGLVLARLVREEGRR